MSWTSVCAYTPDSETKYVLTESSECVVPPEGNFNIFKDQNYIAKYLIKTQLVPRSKHTPSRL